MHPERSLPDQWPQLVASRLSLSDSRLDRLMRKDERFRETCMDYAECATAVRNATSSSTVDLRRIQEYRALEQEIAAELRNLLRSID